MSSAVLHYGDALLRFVFLNWALESTALLAAGLVLSRIPALKPSVRHGLLIASLLAAVVVPLVRLVPAPVRLPAQPTQSTANRPVAGRNGLIRVRSLPQASDARESEGTSYVGWTLAALWLAICAARLAWLGGGIWSVRRWMRRAQPADRDALYEAVGYALADVPVLVSDGVTVPSVVGVRRPRIVLPAGLVEALEPETLRDVLFHEEAHARRRDPLFLFVGAFCHAFLFWNPLAAMVRRRMETAAEDACDIHVLDRGVAAPGYARSLLEVLERSALARPRQLTCQLGFYSEGGGGAELRRRVLRILSGTTQTSVVPAGFCVIALAATVSGGVLTEVGARPLAPRPVKVAGVRNEIRYPTPPVRLRMASAPGSAAAKAAVRIIIPEPAHTRQIPVAAPEFAASTMPVPLEGPQLEPARATLPRDGRCVVYLLDVSSSMRPYLPEAQRQIMNWARRLSPGDSFNVVAFASDVTQFSGDPVPVRDGTIDGAWNWMQTLPPKSGTNLARGLHTALMTRSVTEVVIVSDGEAWRSEPARVELAGQIERDNQYGASVQQWVVGPSGPVEPDAERLVPAMPPLQQQRRTLEAGEKKGLEP